MRGPPNRGRSTQAGLGPWRSGSWRGSADSPERVVHSTAAGARQARDMTDFDHALSNLDLSLFAAIESQSTDNDRRSLLACQLAMRAIRGDYVYLEIGSHLGGSLQPYVRDPRCRRIFSIDKRPQSQPDERGVDFAYEGNSTDRMLDGLRRVSPQGLDKLTCIDADASAVTPDRIDPRPDLCFIDGEHTDHAAASDFDFCRRVVTADGAIVFHDASIIYRALARIVRQLEEQRAPFTAYHLADSVFVIELGDCPLHATPAIARMLVNNHVGYLASLEANDHYRTFATQPLFQALRSVKRAVTRPAGRRSRRHTG